MKRKANDWHTKLCTTCGKEFRTYTSRESCFGCEADLITEEQPTKGFEVKDSGQREQFASGMVRDTTEGKTDYGLALDGPMFKRWAEHLTRGAKKYKPRNWMQAMDRPEYDRFRESALRHFLQWWAGDTDEDHAAAVFFNINGAEYTKARMESDPREEDPLS